MAKDVPQFLHDADAHLDERMCELRVRSGLTGYGLFWILVEKMRLANGYRLDMKYKAGLATSIGITADELHSHVETFLDLGLLALESDEESEDEGRYLYAPSLRKRMEAFENSRERYRAAGKKGAELKRRYSDAEAMLKPGFSDGQLRVNQTQTQIQTQTQTKKEEGVQGEKPPDEPKPKRSRPTPPDCRDLPFSPELETAEIRAAWRKWLDVKRKCGHAYKAREAAEAAIAKLARMGPELALTALQNAIAGQWQGVHEPTPTRTAPQLFPTKREREQADRAAVLEGMKRRSAAEQKLEEMNHDGRGNFTAGGNGIRRLRPDGERRDGGGLAHVSAALANVLPVGAAGLAGAVERRGPAVGGQAGGAESGRAASRGDPPGIQAVDRANSGATRDGGTISSGVNQSGVDTK